jgi:RHS repeat-associated protein
VEIFAGGLHLATYNNQTTYFDHSDWLGTERARTNVSGSVCETIVGLAFGDGQAASGTCVDASPLHFTGKMRDTESNVDNFEARYNSSVIGRFMSPDPMKTFDLSDPQRLNRYTYARDNPLSYVDVGGRCAAPVLAAGQVGICVESYIRAARLGLLNIGLGDNRGPVAISSSATFRTQTLITVDLRSHKVSETSAASVSEVFSINRASPESSETVRHSFREACSRPGRGGPGTMDPTRLSAGRALPVE